jgi:hypothetical protein
MANTFFPEPVAGTLSGYWDTRELPQNRAGSVGQLTSKLYDDSGILKLSVGLIGFDNSSRKGVIDVDTITSISLAGLTASRWAKIEMSVSGTTPTIEVTSIASATDPNTIPTELTGNYTQTKQGFYITSTKRLLGVVWIASGGTLDGIVNCLAFTESFFGSSQDGKYFYMKNGNVIPQDGITVITANYTVDLYDKVIVLASAGVAADVTATFHACADRYGHHVEFFNLNATYDLLIARDGTDTIEGTTQFQIFAGYSYHLNFVAGSDDDWKRTERTWVYLKEADIPATRVIDNDNSATEQTADFSAYVPDGTIGLSLSWIVRFTGDGTRDLGTAILYKYGDTGGANENVYLPHYHLNAPSGSYYGISGIADVECDDSARIHHINDATTTYLFANIRSFKI